MDLLYFDGEADNHCELNSQNIRLIKSNFFS